MNNQWIRKIGLQLHTGGTIIDMSEFHIKFHITQSDTEHPNTATIRVYNLADQTVKKLTAFGGQGEFTEVQLQAGYENGNYNTIFQGTVMQWRTGRENSTSTYLDILAADGDLAYNQGVVYSSDAAGTVNPWTLAQKLALQTLNNQRQPMQVVFPPQVDLEHTPPNMRGIISYGMAKGAMRDIATTLDASWSILNGQLVMRPRTGYQFGEALVINVNTGLIGTPEQTGDGISLRILLNSRVRLGGLIKINNNDINQLNAAGGNVANVAFNSFTQVTPNAAIDADGVYQVFVVEHEGDSRGHSWYSHLICLAVDLSHPSSPVGAA